MIHYRLKDGAPALCGSDGPAVSDLLRVLCDDCLRHVEKDLRERSAKFAQGINAGGIELLSRSMRGGRRKPPLRGPNTQRRHQQGD